MAEMVAARSKIEAWWTDLNRRPVLAESDQWDEWMNGGAWIAFQGEDFTDPREFSEEVIRRAEAAGLGADVSYAAGTTETPGVFYCTVTFRFRDFPETVEDLQAIRDDADEAA